MKDPQGNFITQDINIDGEDLQFDRFAKYTVLEGALEVIVDIKQIIAQTYSKNSTPEAKI
jgi:hypothetical protein